MSPVSLRAGAGLAAAATAFLMLPPAVAQTAATPAAAPSVATPPLDPATPMAPLTNIGIAWPDLAVPDATMAVPTAAASAEPPSTEERRYRVAITGAEALAGFEARFRPLSSLVAGEGKPANAAQLDRRSREDEKLAGDLLRSMGHYDATVAIALDQAGGQFVARVAVDPGAAYHFSSVALPGIDGAGPRAPTLAAALALKPGDPVDADRVATAIAGFKAQLGRQGYPFAQVAEPAIVVDRATQQASFALPVTLGSPARFGRILATGTRPVFSVSHLAAIARFHADEPYDAARLEDFRRALIATGLVSIATVVPVKTADPGVVDIAVRTERAPPRTVAGEFGYGTGEGARAELSWQHRNLLPPEGAVTFRGVAGTREQLLGATLRRSNFHARDRVLTGQIVASHSNLDAYDARTFTIGAGIERQTNIIWQKKWTWSVGGEFVASDERDTVIATGLPRRRTFLVAALPTSLAYDGSDDLLNPTRGYRLSARVSPEASLQKQADGYLKLQFDASAYVPVGERVSFAGRVRLGTIAGAPRDSIAPSRRFYSGGGGSVRGFGYQKIGPIDVDGDPVGGKGLAEAAIEARIRFGNFGVVPFLDAGDLNAASTPSIRHLRYGTGIGGRYYSSFGPIRIDVGTPINRRRGESRFALYVSLGQAF